jgi:DNA-binding response OmpR family regulator
LADAPATGAAGPGTNAAAAGIVVVLADDLIWASRLVDALAAAGGSPRWARRAEDLAALLAADGGAALVMIDLTSRAYDGVAAIQAARAGGARVVAIGQHDDVALRRTALAAGAERVFTYRAVFEGGAALLQPWLGR